jgi:hypothetical protein
MEVTMIRWGTKATKERGERSARALNVGEALSDDLLEQIAGGSSLKGACHTGSAFNLGSLVGYPSLSTSIQTSPIVAVR